MIDLEYFIIFQDEFEKKIIEKNKKLYYSNYIAVWKNW